MTEAKFYSNMDALECGCRVESNMMQEGDTVTVVAVRELFCPRHRVSPTRYQALFELYTEHIHAHRLGTGKTCDDCIRLTNEAIDERIRESIDASSHTDKIEG
jgi:hypothetical protein